MLILNTSEIDKAAQIEAIENNLSEIVLDLPFHKRKMAELRQRMALKLPSFTELPNDFENLNLIKGFAKEVSYKYRKIIQIGFGGSSLGAKAIIDALKVPGVTNYPDTYVLDNNDPYLIHEVEQKLVLEDTLFLVVSKSGNTPETNAIYQYFKSLYKHAKLEINEHFVFITDKPAPNKFRVLDFEAKSTNSQIFYIPEDVGGRFSVLSNAGLVLAVFAGIDVDSLLQGATSYLAYAFESDKEEIFEYALLQYLLYQKGQDINVLMPYSSRLATFAAWYVQLLAESVGKRYDRNGNEVNIGITPLSCIGASDQHSVLQLLSEGPYNKLVTFIHCNNAQAPPQELPKITDPGLEYLSFCSLEKLFDAEYYGTRDSLTQAGRANLSIMINQIDAYHLGSLFMFFELTIAVLGELFNIDVYNQPGVELSKILTKKRLTKLA